MTAEKEFNESTICPLCGNRASNFSVGESNLRFLRSRIQEKNVNEALNICATAWNMFPELRLHSDSKEIVDLLLDHIQQRLAKALVPLEMIAKLTSPLNEKLEGLIEKLPQDVKKQFQEITIQLAKETKTVQEIAKNSAEPIQRDVRELSLTINSLLNKPNLSGLVKEKTLELSWNESFTKDKVTRKGGAGQPDLVIEPFVDFSGGKIGQKIVVERKGGKQKYCGIHLQQTIEHARVEGAHFGLLVYDSSENLVEAHKPLFLTTIQEITLAVTDAESGTWRVAREVFEIFQNILPVGVPGQHIDFKELERTINEMASVNQEIEALRKCNNSTITNLEKTRNLINKLEESINGYQEKLRYLVLDQVASKRFKTHIPAPIN